MLQLPLTASSLGTARQPPSTKHCHCKQVRVLMPQWHMLTTMPDDHHYHCEALVGWLDNRSTKTGKHVTREEMTKATPGSDYWWWRTVGWHEDNDGALKLLSYPPRRLFALLMLSFACSEFRKQSRKGQFLLLEFLLLVMYIMLSLSHKGRLVKYVFWYSPTCCCLCHCQLDTYSFHAQYSGQWSHHHTCQNLSQWHYPFKPIQIFDQIVDLGGCEYALFWVKTTRTVLGWPIRVVSGWPVHGRLTQSWRVWPWVSQRQWCVMLHTKLIMILL
jgi:hypothetical protein